MSTSDTQQSRMRLRRCVVVVVSLLSRSQAAFLIQCQEDGYWTGIGTQQWSDYDSTTNPGLMWGGSDYLAFGYGRCLTALRMRHACCAVHDAPPRALALATPHVVNACSALCLRAQPCVCVCMCVSSGEDGSIMATPSDIYTPSDAGTGDDANGYAQQPETPARGGGGGSSSAYHTPSTLKGQGRPARATRGKTHRGNQVRYAVICGCAEFPFGQYVLLCVLCVCCCFDGWLACPLTSALS